MATARRLKVLITHSQTPIIAQQLLSEMLVQSFKAHFRENVIQNCKKKQIQTENDTRL